MKKMMITWAAFWAVIGQMCGRAYGQAGNDPQPATERTISFVGEHTDVGRLISESGGWTFVCVLGFAAVGLFSLLVIAGQKSSHNRDRLARAIAAISRD